MAWRVPAGVQKLMMDIGLVPNNCSKIELDLSAGNPVMLRYEIYLDAEHFEKLAVVFQALASETKAVQDS